MKYLLALMLIGCTSSPKNIYKVGQCFRIRNEKNTNTIIKIVDKKDEAYKVVVSWFIFEQTVWTYYENLKEDLSQEGTIKFPCEELETKK